MKQLRMAALDIDGVLLEDTFSPVIRQVVEDLGGTYDRELELNVFSQNRDRAAQYLLDRLGLDWRPQDMLKHYFSRRASYLETHAGGVRAGTGELLQLLADQNLRILCYGGLESSHFDTSLGEFKDYFENYVCTNDFRPGVKEILEISKLEPSQVFFVDDVVRPAQECKRLRVPFLGMPAAAEWGFQKREMEHLGVRHLVHSPREVTLGLLQVLDGEALEDRCWK